MVHRIVLPAFLSGILACALVDSARAADVRPAGDAEATTADQMKPYRETISGTNVSFEMAPIRGGKFRMGSPASEKGRGDDEGPQHEVEIAPFWMGKCEVTWDEYELWMFSLEKEKREAMKATATDLDASADAVTRPTGPYTDMTFGMGKSGYPAICMTQFAAFMYTKWLTAKTGHYYRLPTEAEWEYACRAGTTTAYSFGDDASQLGNYAWFAVNSLTDDKPDGQYHLVGKKKPNPWGLCDMHGNVAEWTLDFYEADAYAKRANKPTANPLVQGGTEYPRAARGGAWTNDPEYLRSAARRPSDDTWKEQDPQFPKSRWYLTDADFVGFRVVRPLKPPTAAELAATWDAKIDVAPIGAKERKVLDKQPGGSPKK